MYGLQYVTQTMDGDPNKCVLGCTSPKSGVYSFEVNVTEFVMWRAINKWNDGMNAQNAFPMLNADERECIISGYTIPEWNELFGGYDED